MIDTVVMMLEMGKFAILEPSKFSPPADLAKDRIRLGKNGNYKFIRNPLKAEKETNYYPRLTLNQQCFVNGSHITKLKIEFSAPKLLFKNNFDELKDNDFDLVIDSLFARLNEMGVKTKKEFFNFLTKINYEFGCHDIDDVDMDNPSDISPFIKNLLKNTKLLLYNKRKLGIKNQKMLN